MKKHIFISVFLTISIFLSACNNNNRAPSPYQQQQQSSSQEPNYRDQKDGPPTTPVYYPDKNNNDNPNQTYPDLPKSKSGNSPSYKVLGKTYYVLPSNKNFSQCGRASWYGKKFHGRHTSSGEKYDMYKMSAAHTALPIPAFMKVTNLSNGKSVVVRVNDRGPFHADRIIDLSYAAATKLGIIGKGLGNVEVRSLDFKGASACHNAEGSSATPQPNYGNNQQQNIVYANDYFIQVGAFSSDVNLNKMKAKLTASNISAVVVHKFRKYGKIIYRLRIGPLHEQHQVNSLANKLDNAGFFDYQLVKEKNN
ncbi:MAG: septal ring lytic transglycosylase RlpA family lipoprotein [Gammaproteobacteria bacterium]|nr:MAG: septal ring lytic transglycosylase RlpA family lipoprotein [Gammaproteobacteria bacterium]